MVLPEQIKTVPPMLIQIRIMFAITTRTIPGHVSGMDRDKGAGLEIVMVQVTGRDARMVMVCNAAGVAEKEHDFL